MAVNPLFRGVRNYNPARAFRAPVSSTSFQYGDLVKFSAGVLAALAADDKQLEAFVALENCGTDATDLLVVPFADAIVEMVESGTTTVGASYGISDNRTVDAGETTAKLVTVLARNTERGTVDVKEYQISA